VVGATLAISAVLTFLLSRQTSKHSALKSAS
jgi:hypothetical protein